MNFLIEQFNDQDKKQQGTDSQKSYSSSSNSDNDQFDQLPQNHISSVSNVKRYFNFYQDGFNQKINKSNGNDIGGNIEGTNDDQGFNYQGQENGKYPHINLNEILSHSNIQTQKYLKLLKAYQQTQRHKIQQKLFKSKRIKHTDTFHSQIFISRIYPTKHYQIVRLQVQFLWYRTQILILNSPNRSPLSSIAQISDSGSFGIVYLVKTKGHQKIAIKCLSMSTEQKHQNTSKNIPHSSTIVTNGIKEYFFILLFSQLQIGPKAKTIGGFDIIINKDYLQFATEICRKPLKQQVISQKQQLSKSLFHMHMMRVVHKDIKPSNIMYSLQFKKHVFIDFGCSEVIYSTIGLRNLTKFTGATAFCGDEMFELLSKKVGYVDLYLNDTQSLKKSLNFVNNSQVSDGSQTITNTLNADYQLYKMKHLLYLQNDQLFTDTWRHSLKSYPQQVDDIRQQIMYFLIDIKITQQLKAFYWRQSDQTMKQNEKFLQLDLVMSDKFYFKVSQIVSFKYKDRQFRNFKKLYQNIKIECGGYMKRELAIQHILVKRQGVVKYLKDVERKWKIYMEKQSELFLNAFEIIKLTVVIACYATFSTNLYNATAEEKIRACQLGIQILNKHQSNKNNKNKNYRQFFVLSVKQLQKVSQFYQMFWFQVWQLVPQKFQQRTALSTAITLSMISPAIRVIPLTSILHNEKYQNEYLAFNINLQKQAFGTNKISQPEKHQQRPNANLNKNKNKFLRQKLSRLCLFWQFQLIFQLFSTSIFCLRQNSSQRSKQLNSLCIQLQRQQRKWLQQGIENDRILELNNRLSHHLVRNNKNFNQAIVSEILKQLEAVKSQYLKQQQRQQHKDNNQHQHQHQHQHQPIYEQCVFQISRIQFIAQLLSLFYAELLQMTNSAQVVLLLKKNIIFCNYYRDSLFLLRVYLLLGFSIKYPVTLYIFDKVALVVNHSDVSLRFLFYFKFKIAISMRRFDLIKKITSFLQRQIVCQEINLDGNFHLQVLIKMTSTFIINSFQKINLNPYQTFQSLSQCYSLIALGWKISYFYCMKKEYLQNRITRMKYLIQKAENKILQLQNYSFQNEIIRSFNCKLLKLGEIYLQSQAFFQKLSLFQNSQSKSQSLLTLQITHQHITYINGIKANIESVYLMVSEWFHLIQHNKQFRKLVFSNSHLLRMVIKTLKQKDISTEILDNDKIISNIFNGLKADQYSNLTVIENNRLPLMIAFQYYRIRLVKSNYAKFQCDQFITLYNMSVSNQTFISVYKEPYILQQLFKAFVSSGKQFQQIFSFLLVITEYVSKDPQIYHVILIDSLFQQWFCHQDRGQCGDRVETMANATRRRIDINSFRRYLDGSIKQWHPEENNYMGLVYFYSMNISRMPIQMIKRFTVCVLKSVTFTISYTKSIISTKISQYIYLGFYGNFQGDYFISLIRDKTIKKRQFEKIKQQNNIQNQNQNQNKNRRFFHFYYRQRRHEQKSSLSIEELVKRSFVKQFCYENYHYPVVIKSAYEKKLRRLFQIKYR